MIPFQVEDLSGSNLIIRIINIPQYRYFRPSDRIENLIIFLRHIVLLTMRAETKTEQICLSAASFL